MPSASTATTSGAATKMASSIALCTVSAEEGQPSQLPLEPEMHDAVGVDARERDATGVRPEVRADLVEGALDPRVDVVGMQAPQHQEVAHQLVVGEAAYLLGADGLQHPLQPRAVEAQHALEELLDAAHHGGGHALGELVEQDLDAFAGLTDRRLLHAGLLPRQPDRTPTTSTRRTARRCAPRD